MSRRSSVERRLPPPAPVASAKLRPLLVPATEAARLLGIGRTTLYELVKSGDLTPIHVRRCVRFSMYEIERFVESRRRTV